MRTNRMDNKPIYSSGVTNNWPLLTSTLTHTHTN